MQPVHIYRDHGSVDFGLIIKFELSRNIKFPESYKKLLVIHDALRPEKDTFRFVNIFSKTQLWPYKIDNGIDTRDISFFGFGTELDDYVKISKNQDFDVFGHDNIIAFGISANGDYICFDYRHAPNTDAPHVVVMFHDAYDREKKMLICHVANSFEEFMDSLYKAE